MEKVYRFLKKLGKFLAGLVVLVFAGLLILFLEVIFSLMSAPCTACLDLSARLYQTLAVLAPAIASLLLPLFAFFKTPLKQKKVC